jgi:hypothetical protein
VATAIPTIKTEPGPASEGTLKIEAVYSGKDDVAMAMAQGQNAPNLTLILN